MSQGTGKRGAAPTRRVAEPFIRVAMRAMHEVPPGFHGQASASRADVTGGFRAPATVFRNIGKR